MLLDDGVTRSRRALFDRPKTSALGASPTQVAPHTLWLYSAKVLLLSCVAASGQRTAALDMLVSEALSACTGATGGPSPREQ